MKGEYHIVTAIIREASRVFSELGFSIALGPEAETAYYNFDTLNIKKDHPSRELWDTFWLKTPVHQKNEIKELLRTHTSSVQGRYLENNTPPLKVISLGKVFRNEATDATHDTQFHQMEGLVIGKGVTFATMKKTLNQFFDIFLTKHTKIRFRPAYFPFVEPGMEADILCVSCEGKGCSVCSQTGWVEVLGAGMVHPRVLANGNIDSNEYSGFAFGIGLERIAMVRYAINDTRLFSSADLRLSQGLKEKI